MHTNDRMIVPNWLPADEFTIPSRVLSLPETIVLGFQTFEQTLDGIREALIRSDLGNPCSIATAGRHTEQCQERQSRRLALIRHVGVITDCAQLGRVSLRTVQIVASKVNVVVFQMPFDVSSCRLKMFSQ
jgi:hypothetical protein